MIIDRRLLLVLHSFFRNLYSPFPAAGPSLLAVSPDMTTILTSSGNNNVYYQKCIEVTGSLGNAYTFKGCETRIQAGVGKGLHRLVLVITST